MPSEAFTVSPTRPVYSKPHILQFRFPTCSGAPHLHMKKEERFLLHHSKEKVLIIVLLHFLGRGVWVLFFFIHLSYYHLSRHQKIKSLRRVVLLFALVVFSFRVQASADSLYARRSYAPTRITANPPLIDGIFNDASWDQAEWAGDFVQYEPYDGRKPSQETRFRILYDMNYIYVAIQAFDTQTDSIVKRMTRRDDIDGDIVAIQFDSYHDLRTGFTFFIGVGGTKGDMLMSNDGSNEDETWDPVWWVKTSQDDEGWNAEIKIPFSQLRFDKNGDDTWGLQVARSIYRYDETSLWQPIRRDAPGWVHLLGNMTGMKGLTPRKQTEITPYLVGGYEHYEPEEGNPYATGHGTIGNVGLDAKVGLTNNLTLDLTLNPDFGQVEADPSEVNLSAYETYFSEKRPFFIEGKSILNYPIMFGDGDLGSEAIFYSRRIGHRPYYYPDLEDNEYIDQPEFTRIIGSAKVSGKTKEGLSVGILESVTASDYAKVTQEGTEREVKVEPLTNYFVSRVSKDFNKGNSILGGIITSTNRKIDDVNLEFLPEAALTGGIDYTQYFAEKKYMMKAVSYFSNVKGDETAIADLQTSSARYYQRPDATYITLDSTRTSLAGYGGNFQFLKISGNLNFMAAVAWKSPGVELNDIGYMRSADEILEVLWAGYRFYEPFSIFRRLNLNFNQWRVWDFGGNVLDDGGNINAHASFKNYWSGYFSVNFDGNQRNNGMLRGGSSMYLPADYGFSIGFDSDSRKKFSFEGNLDMFGGSEKQIVLRNYGLEFQYKPASLLSLELEPSYRTRLRDLQFVTIDENTVENRYVFASIDQNILSMSFRINLTLTPELTVQYWGQPFIAAGNYSEFKVITDPLADAYHDRYHVFTQDEITYLPDDELYMVNEDGGTIPTYYFDNPDFNFKEFLSNLVVRWEYKPGSVVYLVWSQNRQQADVTDQFALLNDMKDMWNIYPYNTFLVKFSYRIGN